MGESGRFPPEGARRESTYRVRGQPEGALQEKEVGLQGRRCGGRTCSGRERGRRAHGRRKLQVSAVEGMLRQSSAGQDSVE